MDPRLKNLKISKYSFIFLLIINMLSSIWIIIYDLKKVKLIKEAYPDDSYTGEHHQGYYAQNWFIACCIMMVVNIILSLVAIYSAHAERPLMIMVISSAFSILAVYGAWDKYMPGSVASYLIPLICSIIGSLTGTLILWAEYKTIPQSHNAFDTDTVIFKKNMSKPTTPIVKTFDEADQNPYNPPEQDTDSVRNSV